jgi:thioesterase domain-containing protein
MPKRLARFVSNPTVGVIELEIRVSRVELGAIESALRRHRAVADALCVRRDDARGAELVAYVVPSGIPISGAHLRRALARHLPPRMVPDAVVSLSALPVSDDGEIGRAALPPPDRDQLTEDEPVAPRTPLERRLAGIWEQVLGVSPVGVTDSIFDLGIPSLLVARLLAEIEGTLRVALPLGAVFRAPTIEALAALIEAGADGPRSTSLVPIQPRGSRPPIFCVHGGAGTILHLEPLARALGDEQPFYGLQSRGLYGGAPPLRTVEEMASHYLSEIRQAQPHGPYCFAGYCFGAIVAFEMAQRMRDDGEEVRLLASLNGPSPAWIERWGWFGNQPSLRELRRRKQGPVTPTFRQRFRRALAEPYRFRRALLFHTQRRLEPWHGRLALVRRRPLPAYVRERYFLRLHGVAERAYRPQPYPGEMLVVYGDHLYEDPTLGWAGLAESGIESVAVPGRHTNNRQALMHPSATFLADRLVDYLRQTAPKD